jgi:hypothetical protein
VTLHPPVDVNTGAPDLSCDFCYTATLDNPVMSDTVILTERQPPEGSTTSFESVGPFGVGGFTSGEEYTDFFLQVLTSGGDPTKGAVDDTIVAMPHDMTTTFQPGDTVRWDTHGIQLGYTSMTLEGQNVSAFDQVHLTPPAPPNYRLASNVMLVPIQLVRVLPRNPCTSNFPEVYNATKRDWKAFFDDAPLVDVTHNAGVFPDIFHTTLDSFSGDVPPELNCDPENQEGEYGAYQSLFSEFTQVDQIWTQCNIQFRMIDCPGSALGCPDLIVDDDNLVGFNAGNGVSNCQSDLFPSVHTNLNNAAKLPGVDSTLPLVLAMWNVSGECGGGLGTWPLEVGDTGVAALSYGIPQILQFLSAPGPSAATVPAHEMGHLLGLPHSCDANMTNLMCPDAGPGQTVLTPTQCTAARRHAAAYVKAHWGVTVSP